MINNNNKDVVSKEKKGEWFYSKTVKQHFFHPKNFMTDEEEKTYKADGVGVVGSPMCGDMMRFWIKVDPKTMRITDCRWRTYGCASAIAATSVLSEMITEKGGRTIEETKKIKPQDIMKRLGGLPAVKVHCSVLGDQALRAAIEDYLKQNKI